VNVAKVRAIPDREYGVKFVANYAWCGDCGTLRQSPMPDMARLAAFYPAHYHAQTGQGTLNRIRQDMRLKRLAPLMEGEGAILDFGCGNGAFLLHAAERMPNRTYFGFEISDRPDVIRHNDGRVTIVKGAFEDLMQILPACRMITMNHVIEHLPDPAVTLSGLIERLVPGGLLEGQTPAARSLEHRVFGDYWSGYHAPRHTVVFSIDGLRRFLQRMGLEQVKVGGAFNPAGLAVSLASVGHGLSGSGIKRQGFGWIGWVGLATILAPGDLLLGAPGIQNFLGRKSAG